jgi:dTDP-4-amino-4,6-dideoxygalactose transaminase
MPALNGPSMLISPHNNPDGTRPLRRQIGVGSSFISERAKQLVMEVLDSNRLSAGPKMAQFESLIAQAHNCHYGLMCNSGTSALQIALAALKERHGWQDGDEVLVPALTFVATSNVVLFNGMKPVFVDVEPAYYCIDPACIEKHITPRTRAVMPVHVACLACDMDPIEEICRRRGLKIVEDSAEAMFVNYKGRPVGSFSDIAAFSTYVAHVISTGVGGLCTTNDPELLVLLKSLMNHGRDSIYTRIDDDAQAHGRSLFEIADRRFSFTRLGHSFRATEMEAALGIAQYEERHSLAARRRAVADLLTRGLKDIEGNFQLPRSRPDAEHGYMFYPITILNPRIQRSELIQYLEDRGIETRYVLPLINQPIYRKLFGNLDEQYPVAARLNETSFYVGSHPGMTDADANFVVESLHDFCREKRV